VVLVNASVRLDAVLRALLDRHAADARKLTANASSGLRLFGTGSVWWSPDLLSKFLANKRLD
jgi:hypothetical protein